MPTALTLDLIVAAGAGGSGATATISTNGSGLLTPVVTAGGSGYLEPPIVTVTPTGGDVASVTATLTAVLTAGVVTSLVVVEPGVGYAHVPTLAIVVPMNGTTTTVTLAMSEYESLNLYRNSLVSSALVDGVYTSTPRYSDVPAMILALITQYIITPALQLFPTPTVTAAAASAAAAAAAVLTTIAAAVVSTVRNIWVSTNTTWGVPTGFGALNMTNTASSISAPDGSTNAKKIAEFYATATAVVHQMYVFDDYGPGTKTMSFHFKAVEDSWVFLACVIDGVTTRTWFHLSGAGSVGTDAFGTGVIGTVAGGGGGWYRASVTWTAATSAQYPGWGVATGDGVFSYASTNGNGVYQFGQQLESGALTAYQAN